MKKYRNVVIKVITCICIMLSLTSCWGAHELNRLAIVMGVGIDKVKEPDPVEVTVQVAKPKEVSSGGTSKSGSINKDKGNAYLNLKEKRKSISEDVRAFNRRLDRKLFFSHNQVIILGKNAAESGIEKYMDFFLRERETRLLVWILVSKGSASEILNINPEFESTPGRNIGEMIKNQRDVSQIPTVYLREFVSRLMSKTTAPIAPMIEVSKEDNKKIAYVSETAVFKKDKMVGTLNKDETRGLLWGINKVKDGIIVINEPDTKDTVNITTTHASSKIISEMKDNEPRIRIEIKQEGDLEEQTSSKNLVNPKAFSILEHAEADAIRKEVMAALNKSRELNADIFGFGDIIYQHYPKQWSKIEKDWDQIYQSIHVDVNVDAKLRRTGKITKPIMSKEE